MPLTPHDAYAELVKLSRHQSVLASCADLLEWDEETYMPHGGVGHRSEQSVVLAGLLHERQTAPRIADLLAVVESSDLIADPDSPAAVNTREWRREFDRQSRLPRSLVEERARLTTLAQQVFAESREDGDYARFQPWLEKIIALCRHEAAALAPNLPAYDTLLDLYEPGATAAQLAVLFQSLRASLAPLLASIASSRKRPGGRAAVLKRPFPIDRQKLFAQAVVASLGFDLSAGRIDTAAHPFCLAVGPGDTRLTARFTERHFADGFFATLHEVGHGLYEQGLDRAHYGTPMGQAASLGLHESQSRLWENLVGRSRGFWAHFFPRLRNVFPESLGDTKPDAFLTALNRVEPSPVRAQADELTYNLHTLIRFELEQSLLSGDLSTADLPTAWRDAYRAHLGIEPQNHVDGCLQDGHWAEGLIGYFPTYTLGNVYAAQLFSTATTALGGPDALDAAFAKGDVSPLLTWLRENVHRHGQRHRAAELIRRVTGAAPNPAPLVTALRARYTELYGL